jgi:type IV secretory pathway TraG/TraD family ATPase VirD4
VNYGRKKEQEWFYGGEGEQFHDEVPVINAKGAQHAFYGFDRAGNAAIIPLSDDFFSKHFAFLGAIGTGKTTAIMQLVRQIQASLTQRDILIIFDAKGDFYPLRRAGDVVFSNDQTASGPKGSDYWNIFSEIKNALSETSNEQNVEANILEIANILFSKRLRMHKEPFFPTAGKDVFAAVLTDLHRSGKATNNQVLRDYLDSASTESIRQMLLNHSDLKALLNYVAFDSPQTQGVMSEVHEIARELFLGNFKKEGTLSIRQLVKAKAGRTIFIEYDIGIGYLLSPIYQLLFDLALKEALSREKSEGNVWVVADEFRLIPHTPHFEIAANFGRSLGVKMIIGFQNIEQLYCVYGQAETRSLLSAFSSSVNFHVGDQASREYVKGLFGHNRRKRLYLPNNQSQGLIEQIYDANVVEDWDISRLRTGEAVVKLPGHEPFFLKFNKNAIV